jgi:hypothetical protein
METLTGSVERITYYNPENGYSVVRLRPDQALASITQQKDLVTITGNLPELDQSSQAWPAISIGNL